jgi:16S rRNA (adenine1518-N6/adenine1519-N6)-dimethyltransferase
MTDPNTVRRIVSALEAAPEDRVVEIGPGTGALTDELVKTCPDLHLVEVDERAIEPLRARFQDVTVHHADVLKLDWASVVPERPARLRVIGNIPYNISSQIIFGLLDADATIVRAVLTMQREVGRRLVGKPRTKEYGILSVWAQLFSRPEILFDVSRNVFFPKPDVESTCVALNFERAVPDVDREVLRQVVRAAFNQRRKTLRNSLRRLVEAGGEALDEHTAAKRAEELCPDEFVEIARWLQSSGQR